MKILARILLVMYYSLRILLLTPWGKRRYSKRLEEERLRILHDTEVSSEGKELEEEMLRAAERAGRLVRREHRYAIYKLHQDLVAAIAKAESRL